MKRVLSILLLALTIPVLVNCKKDKHPSEAKGLSITPAVVELSDGEQLQLEVKTSPENASDRDDILASVVWKSKDESVVTVDNKGLLTGMLGGETSVTASTPDGSLSASCKVTVKMVLTDDKDVTAYFDPYFAYALSLCGAIKDPEKITYADVKDVTEAFIPTAWKSRLQSVRGLELMPALKDFSVMGCVNLTELNVSNCTKLESLVADETKLTTLDLSNCPLLHSFSAEKSQLSQITWGEKNELVDVYLNENALKVADMGSMPKLKYLNLERNEIEELHLDGCPKLKHLFVSYNKLKSVDVSGCPEIELRSLYYNPGENGVFKVYHPSITTHYGLTSWLMTTGDERSRVTMMLYCEKSPRIKTQPQSVTVSSGEEFSLKVEMESDTGNLQYLWFLGGEFELQDGLKAFGLYPLEDQSSSDMEVSGSNTNELKMTIRYNKSEIDPNASNYSFVCYICDTDKKTVTYSGSGGKPCV